LRCERCEDDLHNMSVPSALKRMTFAIEVKMFERISLLPRDWHAYKENSKCRLRYGGFAKNANGR